MPKFEQTYHDFSDNPQTLDLSKRSEPIGYGMNATAPFFASVLLTLMGHGKPPADGTHRLEVSYGEAVRKNGVSEMAVILVLEGEMILILRPSEALTFSDYIASTLRTAFSRPEAASLPADAEEMAVEIIEGLTGFVGAIRDAAGRASAEGLTQ